MSRETPASPKPWTEMFSLLLITALTLPEPMYLGPTRYVDSTHPAVAALAGRLATDDDRATAIRIHDFVRDEIAFGWAGSFYDQSASEVLSSGVGFCNTKSTLFVALLRAAGIPARQRFVTIDARILDGLIDPGTAYVDHSFTELWLDDRWLAVDSYIVDATLAANARSRLRSEGRSLGYGVHVNGVLEWDGRSDAFSQLVNDGVVAGLSTEDHGIFADVGAFYASGKGLNRLRWWLRPVFPGFARAANRRADAIRDG